MLASLIFFVVLPLVLGRGLSVVPGSGQNFGEARAEIERAYAEGEMTNEEYRGALDGINEVEALWQNGPDVFIPEAPASPGEEGVATLADPGGEWVGFMPKDALDAVRDAGSQGNDDAARFAQVMDNPDHLAEQTQEWIPRLMFILLPVYACLLALLYVWRSQFLFFDHLIVLLHFHSALYFSMVIGVLVSLLIGAGWVTLGLIFYSNWYIYRLNRVVYGRGALSSVLRVLTLDSIYIVILMSALLTAVILGALSV